MGLREIMEEQKKRFDGPIYENEKKMMLGLINTRESFEDFSRGLRSMSCMSMGPYCDANMHIVEGMYYEIGKRKYTLSCKGAIIEIDDSGNISYYAEVDEKTKILLGRVGKDRVYFPKYKEDGSFEVIGELPMDQVKPTVLETIEEMVRTHPELKEYADILFGGFRTMLSHSKYSEVESPTPEQIKIASLQARVAKLEEDGPDRRDLVKRVSELEGENAELKADNEQKSQKIDEMSERIEQMSGTIEERDRNISSLQRMLSVALEFIDKVKEKPLVRRMLKPELGKLAEKGIITKADSGVTEQDDSRV